MRKEFVEYLNSIGVTKILQERIATIYEHFEQICPDEITDIFVTDYIKQDESREYEYLCFFSEKYFMDAKQFVAEDDFSINPIKKRLYALNIKKKDYDFKKATEKSRLFLHWYVDIGVGVEITLKASKENCDYLRDITLKYVVPNLEE